jgi:hypothetical protein
MWYQKDLQTLEIGHCASWRIHPRIVSQAENAGSIPVARSRRIPSRSNSSRVAAGTATPSSCVDVPLACHIARQCRPLGS